MTPSTTATRATARVAFVTCAPAPGIDADDQPTAELLAANGVQVDGVPWDAPVDWSAYDLAVLRSTWDYPDRFDAFRAWLPTVPRLANPAGLVAWNTDKRYLAELGDAGVPVVATDYVDGPGWTAPRTGEIVVKPAVGAGARDTGRYELTRPAERELAEAHVHRLVAAGRLVMLQPYVAGVDTDGETALLYFDGSFSHAVRKDALLTGPDSGVEGLYRLETITTREPEPEQLAVAERVLAALPVDRPPLYARIDLVPGPVLLEVELAEPSLFCSHAEGAAQRFAAAILATVRSGQRAAT